MLTTIKRLLRYFLRKYVPKKIPVRWVKKGENSWLSQKFPENFFIPKLGIYSSKIEKLADRTNSLGAQPIWEGYAGNNLGGSTRIPDAVRTASATGDIFTYLVQELKPRIIVEFGTAFGVSGMYFLAGLNSNNEGRLLTFDPNDVWAKLAEYNLSQISDRFNMTTGTFEENIDNVLPKDQPIDLAFIDAIHTKEFVIPQLDIVVSRSRSKTIIILDDINFSKSMMECWDEVSTDSRFAASALLDEGIGILELK